MKLYIIRHGDPDYEKDTLTERGWREAELLANRLEKLDISDFYVSPLGRARDTASVILKRLGATAETKEWLREFPPRRWDPESGLERPMWDWLPSQWTEIEAYYDRYAWMHTPVMVQAGVPAEYEKVRLGLMEILAKRGYVRTGNMFSANRSNRDSVAFFCHFGVECVILSILLGISPMPLWHGTCALTSSVTTLVTEERRSGTAYFRMCGFGDVSHLYAADVEPSFSARFCETYDNMQERHD